MMRRIAFVVLSLSLLCPLGTEPVGAQVVTTPNQIVGEVRLVASNPEILALVNGPGDNPPGADEGFSYVGLSAASRPPQDPQLRHNTSAAEPSGPLEIPYEFTVEAADTGIAYLVGATVHFRGGDSYGFVAKESEPVFPEPADDVRLDFEECAGMIELRWEDSEGDPFVLGGGGVRANREREPGTNQFSLQAWGSIQPGAWTERLLVRGDGARYLVDTEYRYGNDPYTNLIIWRENFLVTVGCDEVVPIVVVIPSGGH